MAINNSKLIDSLIQLSDNELYEKKDYRNLLDLLDSTRQTWNGVAEHLIFKTNCRIIEKAKANDFNEYLLDFNETFDLNSACMLRFVIRTLVVILKCQQTRIIISQHTASQMTLCKLIVYFAEICQRDFGQDDIDWTSSPHACFMLLVKCLMKRGDALDAKCALEAFEGIKKYMCEFGSTQLKRLKACLSRSDSRVEDNCSLIYTACKFLRCVDISLSDTTRPATIELDELYRNLIRCLIESKLLESTEDELQENEFKHSVDFQQSLLQIHLLLVSLKLLLKVKNSNTIDYFMSVYIDSHDRCKFDLVYQTGQDDNTLIDFNMYCLKHELELNDGESIRRLFEYHLNAHALFAKLLICVSYDYEVLLDWLISSETSFLAYLVKYAKHLINELTKEKFDNIRATLLKVDSEKQNRISKFKQRPSRSQKQQTQAISSLHGMFELFKELGARIRRLKSLFPYNCEPLLRLLDKLNSFNC
jgi:hypothetical protein